MFLEFGLGHFEFFLTEIMQPYWFVDLHSVHKKKSLVFRVPASRYVVSSDQILQKYNLKAGKE